MVSKFWLRLIMISIIFGIISTHTSYAIDDFESLPPLNEEHTYIQDHAGIFTAAQIDQLQKQSQQNSYYDYDLMVVTMKGLNGNAPKAYAKRIFDTYQVGFNPDLTNSPNINGVVILFDGEHVTLYTDSQLSHYFTEKRVNQLVQETTESNFENQAYSEGLIQLYNKVEKEIPKGVKAMKKKGIVLKQPKHTSEPQNTEENDDSFADNIWFVLKYGKWVGAGVGTLVLIFAGVAYVSPPAKEVEESTHSRLVRMRKLTKQRKKSREKKAERDKEEMKNKKKHSSIDENKKYKNAMRNYKDK
ncbi:TPM domain-containing protein [Staphylococcus simulans]